MTQIILGDRRDFSHKVPSASLKTHPIIGQSFLCRGAQVVTIRAWQSRGEEGLSPSKPHTATCPVLDTQDTFSISFPAP